jgi:dTDP-L-rhamnose 4-epimerase
VAIDVCYLTSNFKGDVMRVLVTGGMGFVGRAVIRKLLERDVESIIVLDNLTAKIHGTRATPFDFMDERVLFVKGDVRLRDNLEPPLLASEVIVHLAAETGTGQSMYDIENYNGTNISATALMLDILSNKKHQVKKVLVASSRAIYGEGKYCCSQHGTVYPETRLFLDMERGDFEVKCPFCKITPELMATSEDSLVHPISFYGITKHFQEYAIMTMCKNIGIASTALRYQNIYGPGQSLTNPYTGILSIFSKRICQGADIFVFEDGKESRDFVYIDDAATITVESLFSDRADGETLNVGSGMRITVLQIANILKEMFKSDVNVYINREYRAGDIRHNYADISKLKTILGLISKTSLEQGLTFFVDWVKQQDLGPDGYDESIRELETRGLYRSFANQTSDTRWHHGKTDTE